MSDPAEAQDNVLESSHQSDSNSDSNSSSSDSSSDSSSSDEESTPGSPSPPVANDQAGVNMDMSQDLDLSQDNNMGNSWGLDDIQQFLANTIPQSGPVDPVFVDHQDSQHATNMDSLVFDPAMSEANTLHEMNEPRLESVCNSTINSAENSIIMENDLEEDDMRVNDAHGEDIDNPDHNTFSTISHNKRESSPKKNKKKRKQQSAVNDDSDSEQDLTTIAKMPPKKSKVDVSMNHSESPPLPVDDSNSSHAIVQNNPPPPPPLPLEESPSKRSKKLSLKDYKAKKEAERLRASTDSESLSSKETSPSPAREQSKGLADTEQSNNDEDSTSADLNNFDILDELDDVDSENDEDSDSLAEDEIDQLLEANVKHPGRVSIPDIEPESKLKKLVLEERGQNMFEVLPQGWVSVTHNSGIPLYLHRESRVVTVSKPYDLGNGSVRKHNIPISAIPCYAYKYYDKPNTATSAPEAAPPPVAPAAAPASCPYSSSTSFRENASPDSTTPVLESMSTPEASSNPVVPSSSAPQNDARESVPSEPQANSCSDKNHFPKAEIATIEESMKQSELTPTEVTNYCKKVFVFKELEIAKFKTWKERRAYLKQSHKKKIENELSNRPTLPEGTKIITIPALEMSNIAGTDGQSALNQKVVKKTKKKWVINPVGKSTVCLLHEYVQQSLKTQPYYQFTELDNAATPYAAIVRINDIEYGRGTGSSKKIAKSEAARLTLEMLIPEIKDKLPSLSAGDADSDAPDLAFFDGIMVEDARVADLCNRTSEPAPYQILVTCLQRNYGLGDTHIHQDMKAVRNGKNEYSMMVNKRTVSVICKNKKDGKQLAAQKLLQQLHPHITSWGSLLRMYGNRSLRKLKLKKEKETEVTGLQVKSRQSEVAPSLAILDKLREEMRNLRDSKHNIVPIGKFVLPVGAAGPGTGLNTDHVDL